MVASVISINPFNKLATIKILLSVDLVIMTLVYVLNEMINLFNRCFGLHYNA